MGAQNALSALRRWSGKVPGASMVALIYMALVSKDKDDWPWYGGGQEAIAEFGLGRYNPDRTDLRAVQRALGPLFDASALTVDRAGANRSDGNTVARYRLNIHERADQERLKWLETHAEKRRASTGSNDQRRTTVSGQDGREKVTQRTTVSDATDARNRRTKEEEEEEELEDQGISGSSTTTSPASRASGPDETNVIKLSARRTRRADETLAAARLSRAAARAAHQAAKETS